MLWSAAGRVSRRLHRGIRIYPSSLSATGRDSYLGYHIFRSNSSIALDRARFPCFAHYVASSNLCLNQRVLCNPMVSNVFRLYDGFTRWGISRQLSCTSVEIETGYEVVRFGFGTGTGNSRNDDKSEERLSLKEGMMGLKKKKRVSRKTKLKELRFYRLKAKKKMKSPNPEVRIRYKLEKAKRKEVWLIEKLRKFELPKAPPETHDPEILTEEERFYLKRTGEKKKHYVPVGRRGVFGGVVLNMHLHWKRHETVKVVCKPCKPGQIHEIAEELARLSKGIIIDIKPSNIVIFYRGKNYVQPDILSPPDTLSKSKALEKYKYEQSLEHTSQFIERLEKELEEYHEHLARFMKRKKNLSNISAEKT